MSQFDVFVKKELRKQYEKNWPDLNNPLIISKIKNCKECGHQGTLSGYTDGFKTGYFVKCKWCKKPRKIYAQPEFITKYETTVFKKHLNAVNSWNKKFC